MAKTLFVYGTMGMLSSRSFLCRYYEHAGNIVNSTVEDMSLTVESTGAGTYTCRVGIKTSGCLSIPSYHRQIVFFALHIHSL